MPETPPKQTPELLAPAGNFEKLRTALLYGADAVYLAGKRWGLRARAENFDRQELMEAVAVAHGQGVKVYVTVNIIAHNRDLNDLSDYLCFLNRTGVDGIIIVRSGDSENSPPNCTPPLPIHLSTQANVTNSASAAFWADQGARRINLARELSLYEISRIQANAAAEIKVFVHGALCISYSGHCLLSHYMTGRNASQSRCAHPCRYSYHLIEEKRPGE